MNQLLAKILPIQTTSGECGDMQQFLISHIRAMGIEVLQDKTGNLYATKGQSKTYPCVVAHMDTVHAITKGGIVPVMIKGRVTGFNPVTMEQTGIGGDDKCGIYAALKCLESLPACKVAFFVDEEVGCHGSSRCWVPFFEDCRFVLQADRRGNSDWVENISGPLGTDEFQAAVKPFLNAAGYSPVKGMMTDVEALRDANIGVSVANMSAGYYNPHSETEYISIRDLNRVTDMMLAICTRVTERFPFVYERPSWEDDYPFYSQKRQKKLRGFNEFDSLADEWPDAVENQSAEYQAQFEALVEDYMNRGWSHAYAVQCAENDLEQLGSGIYDER